MIVVFKWRGDDIIDIYIRGDYVKKYRRIDIRINNLENF